MSRIGKKTIAIPKGVDVNVNGQVITIKGPKGTLQRVVDPQIKVTIQDGSLIKCSLAEGEDSKSKRALWGLWRQIIAGMVEGVTNGFRKTLEIVGVGYKAEIKGDDLAISVGFSKPAVFPKVPGVKISLEGPTKIKIEGLDKQLVGDVAARIRSIRPPEPYQGKGIRYEGELVRKKVGKAAGK